MKKIELNNNYFVFNQEKILITKQEETSEKLSRIVEVVSRYLPICSLNFSETRQVVNLVNRLNGLIQKRNRRINGSYWLRLIQRIYSLLGKTLYLKTINPPHLYGHCRKQAATKIQAMVRGKQARRLMQKRRAPQKAATIIQRNWRRYHDAKIKHGKAVKILQRIILRGQAAATIQKAWKRYNMNLLERTEDRFCYGFSRRLFLDDLHRLYKPTGTDLGSGDYGYVFEVEDKQSGELRAFKLYTPARDNPKAIARITTAAEEKTPHLAKVYALHKTGITINPPSFSARLSSPSTTLFEREERRYDINKSNFLLDRHIAVMERLEGDLKYEWLGSERPIYQIQLLFTDMVLRKHFDVLIRDDHLGNICYKMLSKEDYFRGKRLIDFDYWKYRIQDRDFYLPRPNLLIKRVDYDMWSIGSSFKEFTSDRVESMLQRERLGTKNPDEFAQRFKKPSDPNAKILDFGAV